ncbi:hypothetical protein B0T11DRAFT_346997 [Plectosphaerella cucumerina]|uniref:N-acetyltransferase domain-containing protein n=1 Tax=Plectosphaerella cucumerina TaxID=40658 RepID=A0A8K0XAM7_9PEZI|nr:hypothetical protein B0T11DRAFT_346997 [Plectosphaerella cucumerina]
MSDVQVSLIEREEDLLAAADIPLRCFGHQIADAIYRAFNPGWDTPDGAAAHHARLAARWRAAPRDRNGNLNTMFVQATVPPSQPGGARSIAGLAIWVQLSAVPGHGDAPVANLRDVVDLDALYPGDETAQRFLIQLDRGLHGRRGQVVKEKATADPPAVFVLDLCTVSPDFQRRGIASALVQWGLDEAKRRGGLEALTEASVMGRGAYAKLGFKQEGEEIEYGVDEEFRGTALPSNVFMRTGA